MCNNCDFEERDIPVWAWLVGFVLMICCVVVLCACDVAPKRAPFMPNGSDTYPRHIICDYRGEALCPELHQLTDI